jgi:hypothetical protein
MKKTGLLLGLLLSFSACTKSPSTGKLAADTVMVNGAMNYQTIDGFGVNITPAQWNEGKLRIAIDLLVDDLGATLFRFDCTGLADWLDPAKRDKNGKYPIEYLAQIYSSKVFKDAWATFRYLNSKGISPHFNVSGRIPTALGFEDNPRRLKDFDGYAEMVVSMLWWARDREHLKFNLAGPFNETDLSYPEGPGISTSDAHTALVSVLLKLKEYGIEDIRLIVMDDSGIQFEKIQSLLADTSYKNQIAAFGFHTYGNGAGSEGPDGWYTNPTAFKLIADSIGQSAYGTTPLWMTEYGDLDQSGLIEYEFAWRSTRRLMKALADGFSAGLAWDAFDNFHEHDSAWATYGLLKTDTVHKEYTPKKRYFAARQFYRFVLPGFHRIDISEGTSSPKFNIYKQWQDPLKHVRMLAFSNEQGDQFSLVAMSQIEEGFNLHVQLKNLSITDGTKLKVYRTSRNEDCTRDEDVVVKDGGVDILLKERSIVTITTIN